MIDVKSRPLRTVVYQVDGEDRLTHVNDQWDKFAAENTAQSLASPQVINQPIWHFITGGDIQLIYQVLFERARATKNPINFPYRCDSAQMKRYMHMSIVPFRESMDIQLYSRELRLVPQQKVVKLQFLDENALKVNALLRCSMCNSFFVEGEWLELEFALQEEDLFVKEGKLRVISSVCGRCHSSLMKLGQM